MHRTAILLAPVLLVACAAPRTSPLVVGGALDAHTSAPNARGAATPPAALSPVVPADEGLHSSRTTLKGGWWGSDEDALDDGFLFTASWMRFFTRFFALEVEAGYLDADGQEGGTDADVWSIPMFLNGRFNAPLWVLDVYGGAGAGGFYYDADISPGGDDSGFVLGGNLFLGATVNVADRMALGLEGKYYVTEDADDLDEGLDGFALMLTLGFGN